MSGWGDLGAILSGGVKRDAEAQYLPQLAKNYSAFKALEEAKIARSQSMARDNLRESGKAQGLTDFAMDTMLSNSTVNFNNTGDAGNPYYFNAQKQAAQAAGIIPNDLGAIDVDRAQMNNVLGFLEGKPMKRTDIQDGVSLDPYDVPSQELHMTPLGQVKASLEREKIDTEGTKQGANKALSGQRSASESLTRDKQKNPDKHKNKPANKPVKKAATMRWNPKTKKLEKI